MKVSLNWAQWYSDTDLKANSTDELVTLATERLGGVEGVSNLSKHYEGIVVAKVVSCEKHPNADKLNLCQVEDGGTVQDVARDENGYVQVVCGAPNVREGLLVAWIPPGATVPASYGEKELFVLDARDLRGQLSNGMLASPAELGMSDDHSGILEIDEDVKPGTPLKELYGLDDVIIDIENKMFTHRPDCFGQLGVARELAGIQHKPYKSPDWYRLPKAQNEDRGTKIEEPSVSNPQSPILSVTLQDGDLCPRYMAIVLDNVEIKPSPLWLQSHLKRVGLKPINNVVDITNYMMMLTAQPLHAFDFDKMAKNGKAEIIVRRPTEGEKMTLLDGKEIEPHKDAVLICNPDVPIALGGVMGGGNSEIDENTTRVVLECATFDMYNIRKTSMIHGIFTDAVTRFTKGQPAAQLPAVLGKSVQMFEEVAGAQPVDQIVDVMKPGLEVDNKPVKVGVDFINNRLGGNLSSEEIISLLENVEFKVKMGEELTVSVPFWRTDIEIPEDIVEEVGRLYGFNNLPMTLPKRSIVPVAPDPLLQQKATIRTQLSRAGANEVQSYSFVHGSLFEKIGQDAKHAFKIRNALSPDLQYYRLSILPSLLEKVHMNIKAGFSEFALFELGKVHYQGEMDEDEPGVPNEDNHLALVLACNGKNIPTGAPYYQALRYLEAISADVGNLLVPLTEFDTASDEWGQQLVAPYEPKRSAVIVINKQIWGVVGEFKTSVQKALKLPAYSAGFEVHLQALTRNSNAYVPLSKYPSTEQDVTLKVAGEVSYAELAACLKDALSETNYQWKLQPVTIYQKDGDNHKNVTFRLKLSHQDRTLKTIEVNKLVDQLVKNAQTKLAAEQI